MPFDWTLKFLCHVTKFWLVRQIYVVFPSFLYLPVAVLVDHLEWDVTCILMTGWRPPTATAVNRQSEVSSSGWVCMHLGQKLFFGVVVWLLLRSSCLLREIYSFYIGNGRQTILFDFPIFKLFLLKRCMLKFEVFAVSVWVSRCHNSDWFQCDKYEGDCQQGVGSFTNSTMKVVITGDLSIWRLLGVVANSVGIWRLVVPTW